MHADQIISLQRALIVLKPVGNRWRKVYRLRLIDLLYWQRYYADGQEIIAPIVIQEPGAPIVFAWRRPVPGIDNSQNLGHDLPLRGHTRPCGPDSGSRAAIPVPKVMTEAPGIYTAMWRYLNPISSMATEIRWPFSISEPAISSIHFTEEW